MARPNIHLTRFLYSHYGPAREENFFRDRTRRRNSKGSAKRTIPTGLPELSEGDRGRLFAAGATGSVYRVLARELGIWRMPVLSTYARPSAEGYSNAGLQDTPPIQDRASKAGS